MCGLQLQEKGLVFSVPGSLSAGDFTSPGGDLGSDSGNSFLDLGDVSGNIGDLLTDSGLLRLDSGGSQSILELLQVLFKSCKIGSLFISLLGFRNDFVLQIGDDLLLLSLDISKLLLDLDNVLVRSKGSDLTGGD